MELLGVDVRMGFWRRQRWWEGQGDRQCDHEGAAVDGGGRAQPRGAGARPYDIVARVADRACERRRAGIDRGHLASEQHGHRRRGIVARFPRVGIERQGGRVRGGQDGPQGGAAAAAVGDQGGGAQDSIARGGGRTREGEGGGASGGYRNDVGGFRGGEGGVRGSIEDDERDGGGIGIDRDVRRSAGGSARELCPREEGGGGEQIGMRTSRARSEEERRRGRRVQVSGGGAREGT
mmetsp:Transcript_19057/g.45792  ORF Transcript_19057/g.45792 Transcript_19057/m.45792 type:complete len:235 (+) Transcript_19057:562-1266(+)